jgi:hypothetical protein
MTIWGKGAQQCWGKTLGLEKTLAEDDNSSALGRHFSCLYSNHEDALNTNTWTERSGTPQPIGAGWV